MVSDVSERFLPWNQFIWVYWSCIAGARASVLRVQVQLLIWSCLGYFSIRLGWMVDFPSCQMWSNRGNRECLKYFPCKYFIFYHWIVRKNPQMYIFETILSLSSIPELWMRSSWNTLKPTSLWVFLPWLGLRTKKLNGAAASIWPFVLLDI